MDSKLSILLLLTTVAESSLALDMGSCATGTTIGASLAIIQLAEDKPLEGLARVAELIYTELVTIWTKKAQGICTNSEEAESRAKSAQNESFAAFMLGIPPTAEAYTILQTELDVSTVVNVLRTSLQATNDAIWTALGIVRNADNENYSESRTEVENMFASGEGVIAQLISELFNLMLNGTALIPVEAEDVVACVKAQASSELLAAVEGVAKEMYIVLEAISNIGTQDEVASSELLGAVEGLGKKMYIVVETIFNVESEDDVAEYFSEIAAAHEEVLEYFHREVIHKVSILRNLVIADYLNKNGIVTGLFALQAASGNRFI